MQSDRMTLMAEERAKLEAEKLKNPDLFPETTWVDDEKILETLGIHIPGKSDLPEGYLKLLPSDFIVEEITQDGRQTSVSTTSAPRQDEPGNTVYATLVKCGLSTIEAVEELATLLGTTKDKIQYAGIKDKEAITSQEITIRGIPKTQVEAVSSPHLFLKDIRTGKGVVTKGGLKGNRFTILLRFPGEQGGEKIDRAIKALDHIKQEGFYNFYYLQRFGTPRLNNYKWAVTIIKGQYEKAVRNIIGDPGLREIPFFIKMREEIASLIPDWPAVLERLKEYPLIFPSEIKIVSHLCNNPSDFAGALAQVEEQVNLWINALASLLFNRKVSSYIMAGMKPPQTLPLFFSDNPNDWLHYQDDLEGVGLFPPNFSSLRPFRSIMLNHREVETMDHATIHAAEVVPEGLVVQFTLGKGEYATTFLSHFVNLLSGKPEGFGDNVIDSKKVLAQEDVSQTLSYFTELNVPRMK